MKKIVVSTSQSYLFRCCCWKGENVDSRSSWEGEPDFYGWLNHRRGFAHWELSTLADLPPIHRWWKSVFRRGRCSNKVGPNPISTDDKTLIDFFNGQIKKKEVEEEEDLVTKRDWMKRVNTRSIHSSTPLHQYKQLDCSLKQTMFDSLLPTVISVSIPMTLPMTKSSVTESIVWFCFVFFFSLIFFSFLLLSNYRVVGWSKVSLRRHIFVRPSSPAGRTKAYRLRLIHRLDTRTDCLSPFK